MLIIGQGEVSPSSNPHPCCFSSSSRWSVGMGNGDRDTCSPSSALMVLPPGQVPLSPPLHLVGSGGLPPAGCRPDAPCTVPGLKVQETSAADDFPMPVPKSAWQLPLGQGQELLHGLAGWPGHCSCRQILENSAPSKMLAIRASPHPPPFPDVLVAWTHILTGQTLSHRTAGEALGGVAWLMEKQLLGWCPGRSPLASPGPHSLWEPVQGSNIRCVLKKIGLVGALSRVPSAMLLERQGFGANEFVEHTASS